MHTPNPVKTISQHRQQFQMGGPRSQVQPVELDAEAELAMEIYVRLSVGYMDSLVGAPDVQHLRDIAALSRTAAQAFFNDGRDNG
jgi:hypothetical protein